MTKWRNAICEYTYDPEEDDPEFGTKSGTSFEELPDALVARAARLGCVAKIILKKGNAKYTCGECKKEAR